MINVEEVKEYIRNCSAETKVYFGADSERLVVNGKKCVDYLLIIAVHIDGKHGAKVFSEVQRDENDFDKNLARPKLRLMMEVYKISELFLKFEDFFESRQVFIHLDLNPITEHGSSVAVKEAVGYVKGVCGIDPVLKPDAWAASICADRTKKL